MSIVMTGGGTGGHLAIVRAVKEAIAAGSRQQGAGESLVYIGSSGGQDRAWFGEDADFAARYFLETHGVVNQGLVGKIASVGMLLKTTWKALGLLRRHRAKVVFSVGGYSAAPTAFAALLLRIPLVIHEQNAAVGTLNRILRPFARAFISSYEPDSPIKAYAVKHLFFEHARIREKVKTVLIMGGSQGAKALNELALRIAPELNQRGIAIIHQAGERHIDTVRAAYQSMGIEAEVFGFSDQIPAYMARADLAIARAGASSLWELVASGVPTLFVPYPYAAGDHQYHNARFIAEEGLGWVVRESELDTAFVLGLLDTDLAPMSRKLIAISEPDGAGQIARLLEGIVG